MYYLNTKSFFRTFQKTKYYNFYIPIRILISGDSQGRCWKICVL